MFTAIRKTPLKVTTKTTHALFNVQTLKSHPLQFQFKFEEKNFILI